MKKRRWLILSVGAWSVLYLAQLAFIENDFRSVDRLPFEVRSEIEMANNRIWARPASLSLLCSVDGDLHIVLSTRLPVSDRLFVRINEYDDHVLLWASGFKMQLPLSTTLVERGRDRMWFEHLLFPEALGEPDLIVTPPLDPDEVAKTVLWFDPVPPSRVIVGGVGETIVHMKGTGSASDIRELLSSCLPESGETKSLENPDLSENEGLESGLV
jgi:hypothetical protein